MFAKRNARILYVEDDADTREFVSYVLTRAHYEVVIAESPQHAAGIAQTTSFDLYLIDNWMPGASGVELCGWLREFDYNTPILFLSGACYEQDKRAAFAAGAQGYLTKPVGVKELVEEVSRLITTTRRVGDMGSSRTTSSLPRSV